MENELTYFERQGKPTWGRAHTTTILPYEVTFSDIPEGRKMREHEYFSGFKPVVSYAGFQLQLKRKPTPYIFNYYLPSALFVVVSWASFAIPVNAIPGRVALLMTIFLSLTNIVNSAFANSPVNQGINYLQVVSKLGLVNNTNFLAYVNMTQQIWILSCIGFVFLAITEYFVLLCHSKFSRGAKKKSPRNHDEKKRTPLPGILMGRISSTREVDRHFLYAFPVLFSVYSLVYWCYVLSSFKTRTVQS